MGLLTLTVCPKLMHFLRRKFDYSDCFLTLAPSYCSQWELPALASRLSTYTTLPEASR